MTFKDINFSVAMYSTTAITQSTYPVVYTGDEASVKVNFAVTDEPELSGATAVLHLYFGDSSHIERNMELTESVFSYKLVGTENDHAGIVRTDIIITKDGAKYTKAGYRFRIDTSLEASTVLVEYASDTLDTVVESSVEWLLQAQTDFGTAQGQRASEWIADNDTRADEFAAAQTSRTNIFNASESERTTAFNANETGRSNTFTINENAREAAAEAGETKRDADYAAAEENRDNQYAIAEENRDTISGADHTRADADHDIAADDHTIALTDQGNYDTLLGDLQTTITNADANIAEFDVALNNGVVATNIAAKLTDLETTYAPDLLSVKQQLAQNVGKLDLTDWELQNKIRKSQPIVTFVDDDGRAEVMTKLKPIIDEQNIPITVAIVSNWVGAQYYMTSAQIHLLQDAGWEIASHTVTHQSLTTLTDAQKDDEMKQSKETLVGLGFDVNNIMYPFGARDAAVVEAARKYYRSARTTYGAAVNTCPIETFDVRSVALGAFFEASVSNPSPYTSDSLEFYKYMVDKAVAENGWLVFTTHCATETFDSVQQGYLRDLIIYIKSLNVDIVTYNEGLNRMGNLIDTGRYLKTDLTSPHFVLGANGIWSNHAIPVIPIATLALNAVTNDTPITFFQSGKFSTVSIQNAYATGLPENKGGFLITNRINTTMDFNYQEYHIANTGAIYKRYPLTDTTWSAWVKVITQKEMDAYGLNAISMLAANTVTNDTAITFFQSGRISTVSISNEFATGLPENKGGFLITNRINTTMDFNYQEYHTANSNAIYTRYPSTDTTWSPWVKMISQKEIDAFPYQTKATNAYTQATLPSAFATGITIFAVDNTNQFNGYAGIVTNYKVGNGVDWYKQELRAYGSNQVFSRKTVGGDVWDAWQKISAV